MIFSVSYYLELLLQIWCRISISESVMGASSWNLRVCYICHEGNPEWNKGIEASDSSTCHYRNGIRHEIPAAPACMPSQDIYIHPYGPGSRSGILGSTQIGAKCSWQYELKCSGFTRSQISCQDKLGFAWGPVTLFNLNWQPLLQPIQSLGNHCSEWSPLQSGDFPTSGFSQIIHWSTSLWKIMETSTET